VKKRRISFEKKQNSTNKNWLKAQKNLKRSRNQSTFEVRLKLFLILIAKSLSPYSASKTDLLIFIVYNLKMSELSSSSHFFSYTKILPITSSVIDNAYRERAAWTLGDIFTLKDISEGYLKFIAAGTGIVESSVLWLKVKIFYFDFVVNLSRHS
jgi:hypothetical protein